MRTHFEGLRSDDAELLVGHKSSDRSYLRVMVTSKAAELALQN